VLPKPLTDAHGAVIIGPEHREVTLEHIFTPEQAGRALEQLRPIVERMVAHRRALAQAQARRAELVAQIAGNGGDLSPVDVRLAAAEVEREATVVAACVRDITDAGVQVKDLDEGLLDFPARRGEEDVLLCWKLGEDEIAYWHGLEEGFAGRKPLPF
jgi:hypothetical protein